MTELGRDATELSLFVDNVILYIENCKDSNKIVKINVWTSNGARHKVNVQN